MLLKLLKLTQIQIREIDSLAECRSKSVKCIDDNIKYSEWKWQKKSRQIHRILNLIAGTAMGRLTNLNMLNASANLSHPFRTQNELSIGLNVDILFIPYKSRNANYICYFLFLFFILFASFGYYKCILDVKCW